jgi:hypothetical protein
MALLLPAIPAQAVWNGSLDGDRHPNVGVTYPEGSNPDGDLAGGLQDLPDSGDYCSGVLIAPTLVLVGEDGCFFDPWDFDPKDGDAEYGYVSFDPDYTPPEQENGDPYAPGTFPEDYPNDKPCREPCSRGEVVAVQDGIAVLRLDEAVAAITPAMLPAFRALDDLKGRKLTTVGYGDFGNECDDDGCFFAMERRVGTLRVESVGAKRITIAPVGGTFPCYEDGSGNFLGTGNQENRDVVVALTWHSANCGEKPVKMDLLRLDRGKARDLLCSPQFADELAASPLCAKKNASAQSASADDGSTPSASLAQPSPHKHKSGGKHRGKGKHRG